MPFNIFRNGNLIFCQLCRYTIVCARPNLKNRMFATKVEVNDKDILLFHNTDVQNILKSLTGFDMNKLYSKRKLGDKLKPPEYKFMTTEQLHKITEEARIQAEELMQMPPVVPIRKEINVVLSKDPELIGLTESKFIFTDISFGKSDRTRTIVVRDADGTLRKAYWSERRNANQAYFPRPGRQYKIPKMFQPDYLKNVLERGDYLFILDRACVEFDTDDPDYHRVTQVTYDHIDDKQSFGALRFTRHFGPMVFYLALNKKIDNLLIENLKTNRIEDAVRLVTLYYIVHPTVKPEGSSLQPGLEVQFIKEYIDKESKQKVAVELALAGLADGKRLPQEMSVSNL